MPLGPEAGCMKGAGGSAARRAGCRVLRGAEGRRGPRRPHRWPVEGWRRAAQAEESGRSWRPAATVAFRGAAGRRGGASAAPRRSAERCVGTGASPRSGLDHGGGCRLGPHHGGRPCEWLASARHALGRSTRCIEPVQGADPSAEGPNAVRALRRRPTGRQRDTGAPEETAGTCGATRPGGRVHEGKTR